MSCNGWCIKLDGSMIIKIVLLSPLGVLAVFGLIQLPWNKTEAPAWVQAVGSVAGVLIAVLIASWQQFKAREAKDRADREREIGLASRLYWAIFEVRNGVEQLCKHIEEDGRTEITDYDTDFYESMNHRFITNFDDDLCRKRIKLVSKVRFNLGVLIHSLKLQSASRGGELEEKLPKALSVFKKMEETARLLLDEAEKQD